MQTSSTYMGLSSLLQTAENTLATGVNLNLITHWAYDARPIYEARYVFHDPARGTELGLLEIWIMGDHLPIKYRGREAARVLQAILAQPKSSFVKDELIEQAGIHSPEGFYLFLVAPVLVQRDLEEKRKLEKLDEEE